MPAPEEQRRSLIDWLFRNRRTGQITIGQFPNVALWVFLSCVLLGWLVPDGMTARRVIDWVGVAALAWWALDETFRGVNPWRRMLGVGGCAVAAAEIAALLR